MGLAELSEFVSKCCPHIEVVEVLVDGQSCVQRDSESLGIAEDARQGERFGRIGFGDLDGAVVADGDRAAGQELSAETTWNRADFGECLVK